MVILLIVCFYGAKNVQKAGQIIAEKYPRVNVLHGVQHFVSLFFSEVAKINHVPVLIQKQKLRYNTFR